MKNKALNNKFFSKKFQFIKALIYTLVSCFVIFSIIVFLIIFSEDGEVYETNNILDYGNFTGVYDEEYLKKRITVFFPKNIDSDFENPKYSYKAIKGDSISCEAYLEFSFKSEEEFQSYVYETIGEKKVKPFKYDSSFLEKNIYQQVSLDTKERNLDHALIGKILFNDDTNTVIYMFIMVCDGGSTNVESYNAFFSRFNINPLEYYRSLSSSLTGDCL